MLITRFLPTGARCLILFALVVFPMLVGQTAPAYAEKPGSEGDGNAIIGPEYKIDPDLTNKGNPQGKNSKS
jgi:hypothetical protein